MADDLDLPVGMDAVNRLIKKNSHLFSDKNCKVCSAVLISESQKLAHYQSKKHANKYRRYLTEGEELTPAKKMKADTLKPKTTATDEGDRNKLCPVCNMTFSSPVVALSHYEGKTHAKNLRLKEGGVPQGTGVSRVPRVAKPASTRAPSGPLDKSDPEQYCQLCNATFNNPQMAEQHYKGKKHQKQTTKNKLMTIYTTTGTVPLKTDNTPGSGATGNWFNCDTCNIVLNSIEQYQAHISGLKHKTNLEAGLPPHWDGQPSVPDRKSCGSLLPSTLLSSEVSSLVTGFSSSTGFYPSISGSYSSQSLSSTAYGEGLLPRPSPPMSSFTPEKIESDGYSYFSHDYEDY